MKMPHGGQGSLERHEQINVLSDVVELSMDRLLGQVMVESFTVLEGSTHQIRVGSLRNPSYHDDADHQSP